MALVFSRSVHPSDRFGSRRADLIWFTTFGSPWRSPLSAALAFVLNHAYNYSLSDVCTYGTLPSWPVPMDTIAALLGLRPFVRCVAPY